MEKTCKNCGNAFEITGEDKTLLQKLSPVIGDKTFFLPDPTLCMFCREQRRFTYRNERSFHRRKCDATGKSIIALYPPHARHPVYDQDVWWSDQFDPLTYGRDFDFSRPFFEQFNELNLTIPKPNIHNIKSENCQYTNYSGENRNCYLAVGILGCEDCLYVYRTFYCKDVVDCYDLITCELCYECLESSDLYHCLFCKRCNDCSNCICCTECMSCTDCIGCINLRNKQYHIFNKPYTKTEYDKKKIELLADRIDIQQKHQQLMLTVPHRATTIVNCENSLGDNLTNCRDCSMCFTLKNSQDCRYCSFGEHAKDCMDANYPDNCELVYNASSHEKNHHTICCSLVWYSSEVFYCNTSFNSNNIFGCSGMKKNQYCILNKQYSEVEYKRLLPKIIAHMQTASEWGEFFPEIHSPFPYNESLAHQYYPLTQESVEAKGWKWVERVDEMTDVKNRIAPQDLPRDIQDISDDILQSAIVCKETGHPFKITKSELSFYRKMNLSIPHIHPDERHARRMALLHPRKLFAHICNKCQKPIQTTFQPDHSESIYCEECYLEDVY